MQLVDDQVEHTAWLLQPAPRLVEDSLVGFTHQHDAEHTKIRDENVRRHILHVPPRTHLGSVEAGKEVPNLWVITAGCCLSGVLHTEQLLCQILNAVSVRMSI